MKRREFIALVGGAFIASSSARAQQPAKLRRIGVLETVSPALNVANVDALRRGLRDLGYVERWVHRLDNPGIGFLFVRDRWPIDGPANAYRGVACYEPFY